MYNNGVTARVQIFAARHEFSHWIDLNNTAAHSAELSSYQCGLKVACCAKTGVRSKSSTYGNGAAARVQIFAARRKSSHRIDLNNTAAHFAELYSYQYGLKVAGCAKTGVVLKIMYVW